jgi:prophage regulatory protein
MTAINHSAITADPELRHRDRLLKISEVEEIVGLKRAMIYRLIQRDDFPRQFKPGGHASRWSEAEVVAWLRGQRADW